MNKIEVRINKVDIGDVSNRGIPSEMKPKTITKQVIFSTYDSEAREKIIDNMNA